MVEGSNSWAPFIQNYLVNNVHGDTTIYNACEHGAIYGPDGTLWAGTQGFELKSNNKVEVAKDDGHHEKIEINEFEHLIDAVKNKGNTTLMKKGGVHFLGTKWVVLDGFEGEGYRTQYLKKEGGGAAVTVTDKGIVAIATWAAVNKAITLKGDKQHEVKQSVGFCNNAIDDLSKVLTIVKL